MKKRKIIASVILAGVCILSGCGKSSATNQRPDEEQIRAICELSTLECRYHNVAKGEKTKGEGWKHFGEKDRKYWVEYTGYVKLGVDMSKVSMEVEGTDVIVTMPAAEVQEIGVVDSTFNEDSVVSSDDAFFNKNKITVEDQQDLVDKAQTTMKEKMEANKILLDKAQTRAKSMIQNYIDSMGQATGIVYNVVWEDDV